MAQRYIIRVTTTIQAMAAPGEPPQNLKKFSRVCDDDGQTMSYSKSMAEVTAEELREANPGLTYEVIPDPNQPET